MQYNFTQHCLFEDVYLFILLHRWNDKWRLEATLEMFLDDDYMLPG